MVTQSAFRPGAVEALIRGTGSRIDAEGLEFYRRLFSTRAHVKAAIGLMAHWDLEGLRRDMSALTARLALIVGERDRAVPPSDAAKVTRIVAHARVFTASGVGHLAHEEDAHAIAALIAQALSRETLRDAGGRG
jgi:magnesium chelatase accessory protein